MSDYLDLLEDEACRRIIHKILQVQIKCRIDPKAASHIEIDGKIFVAIFHTYLADNMRLEIDVINFAMIRMFEKEIDGFQRNQFYKHSCMPIAVYYYHISEHLHPRLIEELGGIDNDYLVLTKEPFARYSYYENSPYKIFTKESVI